MQPSLPDLFAASQRVGWRWDFWAQVLRNDDLDIVVCPEVVEARGVKDKADLEHLLAGYERRGCSGAGAELDEREPRDRTVLMRLSGVEALCLADMLSNGSFAMKPAMSSASEKIQHALTINEFDPRREVLVYCTEDEADFLARTRLA